MASQKILEIKEKDWIKGIAFQPNLAVGGLFQQLFGCDPFEATGLAKPSLTGDNFTPGTTIKLFTNFNASGVGYVYGQSDTKLYQILNTSPYTVTDVTAQITPRSGILNAISAGGYYIYVPTSSPTTDVRTNPFPVAIGNDYQALSAVAAGSGQDYIAMGIGPDGNVYIGSGQSIYIILSPTDVTKNSGHFQIPDGGFNIRDISSDGRYLIIIADNNQLINSARQVGNYRSRVYFWDTIKSQNAGVNISADIIWDINDSYLIACRQLDDGGTYVFGRNGLYVCSSNSRPSMIRPFVGTGVNIKGMPTNPSQVGVTKGSLYWVDGNSNVILNGNIYAYGNPIKGAQKIFYTPYLNGGTVNAQTALAVVGDQFWVANADPKVYVQNTGSTRATMAITTLETLLDQPFRYDGTKVSLNQPLTSGQTVEVIALSGNGVFQQSIETKSYNAANPKQTFFFKKTILAGGGPNQDKMENLRLQILTTGGAAVQRIAAYATPLDDTNEDL